MGGGTYSSTTRHERAVTSGYYSKPKEEIFKQREINNAMNPYGISIRESRDSVEHPNSLAIILALDVTGSMGSIPHHLVKDGLPDIMQGIMDKGIADPQLLFLAVGDHECGDRAPLQVGQFESSDELLDKWLTDVFLEGGGGSNAGESYLLAWYFAALHTSIDCLEKRGQKGFLFTIGDEPTLKSITSKRLASIMGDGQYETLSDGDLLAKAREKYNVYHLHITETASGGRPHVQDGWKQLMGDNVVMIHRYQQVTDTITKIVTAQADNNAEPDVETPTGKKPTKML